MRNIFGYVLLWTLSLSLMGCNDLLNFKARNGCRYVKKISDRTIGPRTEGKITNRFFSVNDTKTNLSLHEPYGQSFLMNNWPTTIYKLHDKNNNKYYNVVIARGETTILFGAKVETRDLFLMSEYGYFPFRDALLHDEFNVDRIMQMVALLEANKEKNERIYFDCREFYSKEYSNFQKQRDAIPFISKNFDINPMNAEGVKLYYPAAGRAKYDSVNGISSDGSGRTFDAKAARWSTTYDGRNGVHSWIKGILHDPVTNSDTEIHLMALDGYKPGYGETRAVLIGRQVPVAARGELAGGPTTVRSPEISGQELADLINASLSIAGPHAGQMIVMDGRGRADWR